MSLPPSSPLPRAQAGHFRWVIVGLLCAVAFVLYVDRINILVAAPYLASEFGLSTQALGEVLSALRAGDLSHAPKLSEDASWFKTRHTPLKNS